MKPRDPQRGKGRDRGNKKWLVNQFRNFRKISPYFTNNGNWICKNMVRKLSGSRELAYHRWFQFCRWKSTQQSLPQVALGRCNPICPLLKGKIETLNQLAPYFDRARKNSRWIMYATEINFAASSRPLCGLLGVDKKLPRLGKAVYGLGMNNK